MPKRVTSDYSHLAGVNQEKKRKSRWGSSEIDRVIIPGMPTMLPPNLTKEQEELYLLQLRIEEISRRLRTGDLGIPLNAADRSPSPEPVYGNDGKRTNTREVRTRKKLEDERHSLVLKTMKLNPDYHPPNDYRIPQVKYNDKVFIPQDEYPNLNFVGLLIGPRGNTLKQLEKETGAKIIIRGKGSIKEGKLGGRKDGMPLPGEDEPLHAWITAPSEEVMIKAVKKINQIIKEGIETPDTENELRKQQLRELALINGTLKENDGLAKLRQIAEAGTIATNNIICGLCGGTGHLTIDCKNRRDLIFNGVMPLNPSVPIGMVPGCMLPASLPTESDSMGDVPPPGVSVATTTSSTSSYIGGNQLAMFYGTPSGGLAGSADCNKMDSEYTALMAELGVKNSSMAGVGQFGSTKYIDKTMSLPFRPMPPPPMIPPAPAGTLAIANNAFPMPPAPLPPLSTVPVPGSYRPPMPPPPRAPFSTSAASVTGGLMPPPLIRSGYPPVSGLFPLPPVPAPPVRPTASLLFPPQPQYPGSFYQPHSTSNCLVSTPSTQAYWPVSEDNVQATQSSNSLLKPPHIPGQPVGSGFWPPPPPMPNPPNSSV